MRILLLNLILLASRICNSQSINDTLKKGTFILHKFQQAIGKEKYSIVLKNDTQKIYSDFKFTDRGTEVPLTTSLFLDKTGMPVYFNSKGKTSRFSVIDNEFRLKKDSLFIRVNQKNTSCKPSQSYFLLGGYSPVSVQMQLIQYWKSRNKPEVISVYPNGKLKIIFDGHDTLWLGNKREILERYFVKGIIWGNEIIWTNKEGNLVALFTNDAEGDKFEAIDEAYLSHLPHLITKAAVAGMRNLKTNNNEAAPKITALIHANIVDVIAGKTIRNATLLINKGKIAAIDTSNKIRLPEGALTIDLDGKYILPGLWDMHAHFQQVEWGPAYLAAGVTTVRDCGNEFDFINAIKNEIDKKNGIGPKIIKAGIIDGSDSSALGIVYADNREQAKAVVKKYYDAGFEQIKIYSSVKPEMIKVIATEAHKLGLSVTGHVPDNVKLLEAIELGQDQVNHFTYIFKAMRKDKSIKKINFNDSLPQKVLSILKEKKIVVDPTLGVYGMMTRSLSEPFEKYEPGIYYVTEDLKEIFRNSGVPEEEAKKRNYLIETGKEIVFAMHKAGITIVAGTDMGVPGFSIYKELELYKEAGLTELEAIQSATIVPAKVMNKENELGSISLGKIADLIVVDKNPLENISNLRTVSLVMKDGKVYNPGKLRELVDFKAK